MLSVKSTRDYTQRLINNNATACPQDIAFPTDIDLLNDAREKSEELMDILF